MSPRSSRSFDEALADALRPMAADARLPDGLLDVPVSWVRGGRVRRGGGRLVRIAAAVAAAVIVALLGAAALGEVLQAPRIGNEHEEASVPLDALDLRPRVMRTPALVGLEPADPVGPIVQLAHGKAMGSQFRIAAYRSSQGYCMWFTWQDSTSDGCGSLPQDDSTGGAVFGSVTYQLDPALPGYVGGFVAPGAGEVWIESAGGTRADALVLDTGDAEIEAHVFLAFLPIGFEAREVVAADADGAELLRIDIGVLASGIPPADGGMMPTSREPRVYAVVRNHTDAPVESSIAERSGDSEGSASGPTPPCDIASTGIGLFEGKTWWITVEGVELFHSDDGVPEVSSGEVLEIVIDVRPGAEPEVTASAVVPVEESAAGAPVERGARVGRSARLWDLADGLECDFNPAG